MVREKKHRLDLNCYIGNVTVAFTICVFEMKNLFNDKSVIKIFEDVLTEELNNHSLNAHVYLFMKNHLHIITTGKNDKSNCLNFVKMFKQKTGYWLSENRIEYCWQKDFYDHIIRDENDVINQTYYVLRNPVRTGLVNHWKDYPYKGSTVYDLNELEG